MKILILLFVYLTRSCILLAYWQYIYIYIYIYKTVVLFVVEVNLSPIMVVINFILFGIFYEGIFESKFYVYTPAFTFISH